MTAVLIIGVWLAPSVAVGLRIAWLERRRGR